MRPLRELRRQRPRISSDEWLSLPYKSTQYTIYSTKMIDFLSTLPVWQLWLLGALMLFALEIFTPGFILACFGVGALVAVPVTLLHGSWLVQVIAFCAGSLLALWLLQPLMCKWFATHDAKTGMDALVGRRVVLTKAIAGEGEGLVAVDGDVWRATSPAGSAIPKGTEVRITGYRSIVLEVEPIH